MHIIADLQLHSRFSRAVSKAMAFPFIASWAKRKGIGLVATGDWTHPMWFREIERDLEEMGNGLLQLRSEVAPLGPDSPSAAPTPLFLLATEISCIYSQGGRVRRVHTLIWVPTIESARKISQEMTKRGCNLMSDGRPIVGLTSIHLAELVFTIEPKALIIPAHIWTPWFSVYGSLGGFDSIEDAFGPFAKNIYAVETGLSSNPAMNWRIKELDARTILSFSDAHSGPKLGREATVFDIPDGKLGYEVIYDAIVNASAVVVNENFDDSSVRSRNEAHLSISTLSLGSEQSQNFVRSSQLQRSRIAYTLEFYPEEGKYHYTGHRACGIRYSPEETKKKGTTCPVCGKALTVGVMERVEFLAARSEAELKLSDVSHQLSDIDKGVKMIGSEKYPKRPPFVMLVPLQEIIAQCIGSPVASVKVQPPYTKLIEAIGDEFSVLLKAPLSDIQSIVGERIAAGIHKVRTGDILIDPGYDGVFGVVKLWKEGEKLPLVDSSKEQLSMF